MAERLRAARVLKGFHSAAEAARAMGIAEPTYHAHENGTRGFHREAERYAAFFRVDIGWLLTGAGEPRPGDRGPVQALFDSLPPEGQQEARRQLELVRRAFAPLPPAPPPD